MFDDPSLWLFALAWFLAGFVNSIAGMGAAMVALPIVAAHIAPATLVPATSVCVAIISIATGAVFWRHTRWRSLKALLIGAIPGAAAGLAVLLILPVPVLQLSAGIIMILFVGWQFSHPKSQAHGDTVPAGLVAGFAAGFINTSISYGNPPVAIYSMYAGWEKLEVLGTMNVYTFLVCLITMTAHASAGLYTMDVFWHAVWGGPATVLGMLAALPLAKHISQAAFRRILLLVIGSAGILCLVQGIHGIW